MTDRGRRQLFRPVGSAAVATSLVVVAAVCWLKHKDRLAGPLPPFGPALFQTDRIGPQVDLLAWPGFLLGATVVAVVCWCAAHGQSAVVRMRTALAAGATAGSLFFTYARWLAEYNATIPFETADKAVHWGSIFVAPAAGLLTGLAAWTALGRGAARVPFRGRLVLAAATASAILLLLAVYLLRRVQDNWGNIDNVSWIALTTGVPAVGLLTGLVIHFTTVRSLRPVEAIRREMEDITSRSLDRRVPVPDSDDVIAHLARTTNDTLDRLEQASARQQQFVADAAHELRSPLAGLRAQLESALRHPEGLRWPSVVADAVADVVRLQDLADDLLLLARMDGTRHRDRAVEEVDLAAVAEDLVREHQHLPVAGKLELTCDADGPAPVPGDPWQLERLLRNLLGNACRHAARRVTVRTRVDAGAGSRAVVLEVIDDGPGIPHADRERVFERFTRLDAARARASGGAGLGLPIAREIAARHGGTLRVTESSRGARLEGRFPIGVGESG
ncbi:HAMP domain-containing sensor histidine kinase [Streptomyces sp. NPDC000410]|uniref:sensor histidine kinase n=1 Tax=Streptomyces sp. NPDC000410 TaxID=3154254 RepID=UPI0033165BE2